MGCFYDNITKKENNITKFNNFYFYTCMQYDNK